MSAALGIIAATPRLAMHMLDRLHLAALRSLRPLASNVAAFDQAHNGLVCRAAGKD